MFVATGLDVLPLLERWIGAWAEPWDYKTGHATFRLKLQFRGKENCVVLLLKACDRITFDVSWDNSKIKIEKTGSDAYLVTDAERLNVQCGGIAISGVLDSYTAIAADPFGDS